MGAPAAQGSVLSCHGHRFQALLPPWDAEWPPRANTYLVHGLMRATFPMVGH